MEVEEEDEQDPVSAKAAKHRRVESSEDEEILPEAPPVTASARKRLGRAKSGLSPGVFETKKSTQTEKTKKMTLLSSPSWGSNLHQNAENFSGES